MSTWMNDAAAVPNHNGNNFAHMTDPTAAGAMMDPSAFMGNPAQFNAAAFPGQQQMVAMPNGPMRNASPGFQGQPYQTNPVIPSKRPRPREDSLGAGSPRQNPGMLPTSRSETPQQFPGYQPGSMPPQGGGQPSPYPHLQPNGSANATPSPIMANMRPGSVPQRVATASPHPFSPSASQFGPQASPIPSEMGTPQPNAYMHAMPPGFNPNFTPTPSPARPSPVPNAMAGAQMMQQQMGQMPQQMGQMPNQMYAPQMPQARTAEQQKMQNYQMRLQQHMQSNMPMNPQMQAQAMGQGRGMIPNQPMQMPNGQMPPGGMRPQQRSMPRTDPEQFMKSLANFMAARGMQLEASPTVADRPVSLLSLFQAVQSKGAYQNTTAANLWPHVSNSLGLPPNTFPQAPQILKGIYERNLLKFEEVVQQQNRQKMMVQNMQKQAAMGGAQGPGTPTKPMQQPPQQQAHPQQQMAPQQKMMNQGQQQQHMQQGAMQTPTKQMSHGNQQPAINGFSTPGPHPPQGGPQAANAMQGHARNSLSRSHESAPTHGDFSMTSPAPNKAGSMSLPSEHHADGGPMTASSVDHRIQPFGEKSDEYSPCSREISTYGGYNIEAIDKLGAELEHWKFDVPAYHELGVIDLHALTRSLQSGIHGEMRLALDTLATVTSAPPQHLYIYLRACEELVEALIDCAEEQIELLAEDTVEVSDEIQLTSYEDVARACRLEKTSVRDIPAFGTPAYTLDRAVDRLLCITTILRNLSFPDPNGMPENQLFLADEQVVRFYCVVIRYLGTRQMLLRTFANTLDFMKDAVTLLSNIAGSVEIPGKEEALCLLQFLLAFSPTPGPTVCEGRMFFTSYEPLLHPYLPNATDALAKLFARDEPNRSHYKAIFAADATSTPPYDLLTRTFALTISPIPDQTRDNRPGNMPSVVEARKPILMQGLLAAEVLASLAPGPESDVTRMWLSSGNGFAQNLFRLIRALSIQFEQPRSGPSRGPQQKKDTDLVYIACVGISMLKKLAEKAKDPNNPLSSIPPNVLPSRDSILGALQMNSPEWAKEGLLQDLIAYAALED